MNQSTIPHTEIGLRLTICSEFLLNEEKPIEELYRSWMRRIGGQLIEFTEFEYWYRRFKNNQFDLGYDTSLDSMEISEIQNTTNSEASEALNPEIPEAMEVTNGSAVIIGNKDQVEVAGRDKEDLKLNHQFNEKDVPLIFQNLINDRLVNLKKVYFHFDVHSCYMKFDEIMVFLVKKEDDWMISYENTGEEIMTDDPEKSIIDHLWFVLRNPNIKLECLSILASKDLMMELIFPEEKSFLTKMDKGKVNTLLLSMLKEIDHKLRANIINFGGFSEGMFLSMLKHIDPETLVKICFDVSWKKEGNYEKLKEILETDQWKQAKKITSYGVSPLKIEDLIHYEMFHLEVESITPKDVLRVTEVVFNSTDKKCCTLSSTKKKLDFNAILNVLRSQNDGSEITEVEPYNQYKFCYIIWKLEKYIILYGDGNKITIQMEFNEKDVPKVFQDLMKDKMDKLKEVELNVFDQYCKLSLDEFKLTLEKKGKDWLISYNNTKKTIKTDDPEKLIIDHLWFVMKNPDIKLSSFWIVAFKNPEFELFYQNQPVPKIDFGKLNTLLHSMVDSIKHQFHTDSFHCRSFNINTFLSMLKHLKPGTLKCIISDISSKEEGSYQKLKKIVEMDQWKQAERITTSEVIPPLKIEDFLHCEVFMVSFDKFTPEDLIRVKELFINSTNSQSCSLFFENEHLDINAYRKVLLPNSLSENRVRMLIMDCTVYTYKLPNSPNHLSVTLNESNIRFEKVPKLF